MSGVDEVDVDKMYKGQFGQDRQVIDVIYNKKRDGFFVEIGAYDGIESSNTYVLEKVYGWKGLCVECNPCNFDDLKKNRDCHISFNAVFSADGLEMDFIPAGGASGLRGTQTHNIRHRPSIKVITKTMTTLLDEINAPSFIEFLSLDTEGSELEILKAHNWSKYKFGYITVEHNHVESNRMGIRSFLLANGYEFIRENNVDDEYKLTDLASYL